MAFKSVPYVLLVAFAVAGIGFSFYRSLQAISFNNACIQEMFKVEGVAIPAEDPKNITQNMVTSSPVIPNVTLPPQPFPPRLGFQSDTFPPPCPQNTTKISLIYTRGERFHGTHWVKEIINQNSNGPKCTEPEDFWKHGFLDGNNYKLNDDKLLIVLTRDAFTWLPKMHAESYCQNRHDKSFPRNKRKPLSQWMRSFYNCEDALGFLDREAENIITLRTSKYKSWLVDNPDYFNYDPPYCKRVHLRYEAIKDDQEGTIGATLKRYGIPLRRSFRPVTGYTKWGKPKPGNYQEMDQNELLRKHYSVDDLKWILDNLDLDFEEKILGHNYDYVREYIKNATKE